MREALYGAALLAEEHPRAVIGEHFEIAQFREYARMMAEIKRKGQDNDESTENFRIGQTQRHMRYSSLKVYVHF